MQIASVSDARMKTELEQVIRENQVSLKRLCFLYLHDEALADDAVQETFLKAYQSWESYRNEASEKTWLTRIAINTCKNMLRSAWFRRIDRTITVDRLPSQTGIPDPESSEIAIIVMNLPRKLREIILLCHVTIKGGVVMKSISISDPACESAALTTLTHAAAADHTVSIIRGNHPGSGAWKRLRTNRGFI